jgi:hypothetical protein
LSDDVQRINERVMLLMVDRSIGGRVRRLLEVTPPVAALIANANAQAIGTAIRCGLPLVTFTRAFHDLAGVPVRNWPRTATAPPPELRDLTVFVLHFAHELVLRNITLSHAFFGFSRSDAEMFRNLPMIHLETLANRSTSLLRLRAADVVSVWNGLFVGGRCADARAQALAHRSAWQTLLLRKTGSSDNGNSRKE